ncbi:MULTISPECIES: hypothetical protein [Catenuloplanes]|uniref:Lipoprotein n=1 Tax=Catenuloplanes niger TaxID=587534 RepID=A0AAE3ZJX8_9ACTN|nr:hypothetical protein [Catenuloplanes niger]MDR7320566.1 hypothetical protein [Catenuloplanes niger]
MTAIRRGTAVIAAAILLGACVAEPPPPSGSENPPAVGPASAPGPSPTGAAASFGAGTGPAPTAAGTPTGGGNVPTPGVEDEPPSGGDTTKPAAPGARTKPAAPAPSSETLRGALLTGGDLDGFTVTGEPGQSSDMAGCTALDSDFSAGAQSAAEVLLSNGPTGPFVRERLRRLTTPAAQAAVRRVRSAASGCATYTATDAQLGAVTFTVRTLGGVPGLGAETAAVRITMAPARVAVKVYQDLVITRRGDVILMVSATMVGTPDDALIRTAARVAYDKMLRRW